MIADTNTIIRTYLITQTELTDLVGGDTPRIYCPRLPENATLPAVGFFTRGGLTNPHIEKIVSPSVQFQCWATDVEVGGVVTSGSIIAREVYRALFTALQGIQMTDVVVGGTTYSILSAVEEVQGQDLVDADIENYFNVLSFFEFMIRADT